MRRCFQLQGIFKTIFAGLVLCVVCVSAWAAPTFTIEGVSGDAQDNLKAYLGTLETRDLNSWRTTEIRLGNSARQAMQSIGFYDATFRFSRSGSEVKVHVEPGDPVFIRTINLRFKGEAGNDIAFTALRESLPLRVGDVLHHGRYEALKGQVQTLALELGYFDGDWESSQVLVDVEKHLADIELVFNSGPRYRFGEVEFIDIESLRAEREPDVKADSNAIDEGVLQDLVPFQEGDYYNAAAIIKFNKSLLDSRYFGNVRVRADSDQAVDQVVPVRVTFSTRDPNSVDVGLGYSTDVGPRLSLWWRRPLFNEKGHGIEARTEVSEVRSSFEAQYSIPWTHPIDDTIQILTGVKREEIDETLTTYTTVLGVQRQTKRDEGWQRIQSLRFTRDTDKYSDEEISTDLLLPGFSLNRVRSKGGLDPHWGDRQFYQIELATPELISDAELVSLRAGFRMLRTLADKHQFQLRLDGGTIWSDNFDSVPSSLRFFAGGDQSIRGYDYKSIAPRDADDEIVGGRHLATGTLEYGYLFLPSWRGAVFVDAGNAFDDSGEPFKVGTGVGIRWISPVGAVRLDFAWGVSESPAPFRIHFSMGPTL